MTKHRIVQRVFTRKASALTCFLGVLLFWTATADGQTLSGTADGYFSHNFNRPPSEVTGVRAFDTHHDRFRLNLAKLADAIEPGQATTLRWETQNATMVTIDPAVGAVEPRGSRELRPAGSVTYTATATGPGGSASATARVTVNVPPPPARPGPDAGASLADLFRQNVVDVLFDFDRAEIRLDQVGRLQASARWLRDNPGIRFTIEGHADERGSQEYNLGLGDRRANVVRQFLISEGIAAGRVGAVSYGKERPICQESNETCWQRNRRAAFRMNP